MKISISQIGKQLYLPFRMNVSDVTVFLGLYVSFHVIKNIENMDYIYQLYARSPVLLNPPPQAKLEKLQTSPIAHFKAYFNTISSDTFEVRFK